MFRKNFIMNKISVVIPTYNRKEQIKILIQSLLPQKQFLEEIIIAMMVVLMVLSKRSNLISSHS